MQTYMRCQWVALRGATARGTRYTGGAARTAGAGSTTPYQRLAMVCGGWGRAGYMSRGLVLTCGALALASNPALAWYRGLARGGAWLVAAGATLGNRKDKHVSA